MNAALAELPRGHFGVIAADPPWTFETRSAKGKGRSAERHYRTMSLDALKALPVAELAAPDSFLFLWSTGPHLPQALELIKAWGFEYSGIGFTWVKEKRSRNSDQLRLYPTSETDLHVGMGYTTRKNSELSLLARRGHPKRLSAGVREIILSPVREHSRKPDAFYQRVQEFAPGPYLEIFARECRPNWVSWGDQSTLFDAANAAPPRARGPSHPDGSPVRETEPADAELAPHRLRASAGSAAAFAALAREAGGADG